jgi:RND family efflux transporter MFP subunit
MKRILIVLLLGSACAASVVACDSSNEEEVVTEEKPRPVRFERVAADSINTSSTFQGTTQAEVETSLSFRVTGRVQRVEVEVGDRVREGDLIGVVETTDQQLQVEQQQAQRGQLAARVELAESQYKRTQRLFESGNASASDLEVARTELESARASLRSLDQQIRLLQRRVSYGRLEAPQDSAVADVMMEVGENITAGQPVVELESEESSGIEVKISVPEGDISKIQRGDKALITLSALPDVEIEAEVTEVGVSPVSGGGTFPVTLKLLEEPESLRPGMTAEARFTTRSGGGTSTDESFYVSPDAVVEDQQGRFVWIAVPTDEPKRATVEKRRIDTGEMLAGRYEVRSGLSNGDRVVTAGMRFLTEGQTVRLIERFNETPVEIRRRLENAGVGAEPTSAREGAEGDSEVQGDSSSEQSGGAQQ